MYDDRILNHSVASASPFPRRSCKLTLCRKEVTFGTAMSNKVMFPSARHMPDTDLMRSAEVISREHHVKYLYYYYCLIISNIQPSKPLENNVLAVGFFGFKSHSMSKHWLLALFNRGYRTRWRASIQDLSKVKKFALESFLCKAGEVKWMWRMYVKGNRSSRPSSMDENGLGRVYVSQYRAVPIRWEFSRNSYRHTVSGYIRLVISNWLMATVAIPRYRHLTVQIYTVHLVLNS